MIIIGYCFIVLGCFLASFGFSTLKELSQYPSWYLSLNDINESTYVFLAVMGVVLLAAGACMVIFSWLKRRNKSLLDSIENTSQPCYCRHCDINVSPTHDCCPICGKNLKE